MTQIPPAPGSYKESLRAIRIVYKAMISGALLFAIIVLFLNFTNPVVSPVKEYEKILLAVIFFAAVTSFSLVFKSYRERVAFAKSSLNSLSEKLNHYQATLIRYIAVCEVFALSGIILFFVTGNYLMLFVTAAMLAAMWLKNPTLKRIAYELGLSSQEQQELQ